MNYRHAYHAGNFSDVFKHVVLARILVHLALKDAAIRVIDTHAGVGLYSLEADEAQRTGEWHGGIGRVSDAVFPPPVADLLEPWLGIARELLAERPPLYAGSPVLAQRLTRPQDRLVLCEKHPQDARALSHVVRRDRRTSVRAGDGWEALVGLLPPPERRGLVLIDPPYEQERELSTVLDGLRSALRRWATGIYAVWYPVKARRDVESFLRKAAALPVGKVLCTEIGLYDVERVDRLNGCGMLILNPPWRLDEELRSLAPALARVMAHEGDGTHRVEWLKSE
jgi:23S rRNA (adenine2030-N6)-methyltransferase